MLYLKLDGETIMGHDYYSHDDYNYEIDIKPQAIVAIDGCYNHKLVNGKFVLLSNEEIENHPLRVKNKLAQELYELRIETEKEMREDALIERMKQKRPDLANIIDKKQGVK